jgi:mannosyltransferase
MQRVTAAQVPETSLSVELDERVYVEEESRQGRAVGRRVPKAVVAAAVAAVAVGVVFSFLSRSELWLDEALTVNIAKLPLSEMPEALRHDGSPPLYYVLLHGWMQLFGDGNVAVRALSGVFAVASLPLMWLAGRRLGGRRTAWASLLLLSTSPFAIKFASQTRMYSLLVLLSLLGYLALTRFLEHPAPAPFVAVAVVSGLLALTHYWAFYLIGATTALLALQAVLAKGPARRPPVLAVVAVATGGVLFLPWLRSFVFQLRYTGTPWQRPARFTAIFDTISEFSGGNNESGRTLLVVLLGLAGLGLFGRACRGGQVQLGLVPRRRGATMAAVAFLTLAVGLAAGYILGGAFAFRYASVVLAPFLLLVALGVRVLTDRRLRWAVLAVVAGLGLVGGWAGVTERRTQAGVIAQAIEAKGRDGDVVAYCPDQLGPAVSRLLSNRFDQLTFPAGLPPQRVDWVQYEARQRSSNPTQFATDLDRRAGDARDVWLVRAPAYATFKNYCEIVDRDLGDMRPAARLVESWKPSRYGEAAYLIRYPSTCRRPLALREQPIDTGPNPCPPGIERYLR